MRLMSRSRHILGRAALALAMGVFLAACDPKAISELEEGVSTEADVRARFGPPEVVWEGDDGAVIYEYNRQPEGYQNYHITIGPDGTMRALRQVLNERTFAQIRPGMSMEEVRKTLGRPMKVVEYPLKGETHYDWRWRNGPNESDSQVFTVVFGAGMTVVSTMSMRDPDLDRRR